MIDAGIGVFGGTNVLDRYQAMHAGRLGVIELRPPYPMLRLLFCDGLMSGVYV
jgi:hypothetical protein